MNIVVKQEGTPYEFALEGRLDTNTSPELEAFVKDLYQKDITDLAVDMSQCVFVSSAGLRVIVAMQKHAAMGGNLVFRNVLPEVMDVFEMTGFNNILTFE